MTKGAQHEFDCIAPSPFSLYPQRTLGIQRTLLSVIGDISWLRSSTVLVNEREI